MSMLKESTLLRFSFFVNSTKLGTTVVYENYTEKYMV